MKRILLFLLFSTAVLFPCYALHDDSQMIPEHMPSAVYRSNPDLKIYFMYPDGLRKNERRPAIVFFYGGGWNSGDLTQFEHQARILCDKGMVACFVDYRVRSRYGTDPSACVEDAKSAMRYLKTHAKDHHINVKKMVASGGSAGGHLAAATAFVKEFNAPDDDLQISPAPAALVLFNPVFNNAPAPEGYGYERVGKYFPAISPAHNIGPGAPPTLIMLGTEDQLVPVSTALDFKEKVEAQGSRCDLELYEGARHAFFNYRKDQKDGGEYYQKTLKRTLEFLRTLRFIK